MLVSRNQQSHSRLHWLGIHAKDQELVSSDFLTRGKVRHQAHTPFSSDAEDAEGSLLPACDNARASVA